MWRDAAVGLAPAQLDDVDGGVTEAEEVELNFASQSLKMPLIPASTRFAEEPASLGF